MRRIHTRRRHDTGMRAALKAAAILLAVSVLAMVAGHAAYMTDAAPAASPTPAQFNAVPDVGPVAAL